MAKRRKLTEEHVHNYRTDQKVNVDTPLYEYDEIDHINELLIVNSGGGDILHEFSQTQELMKMFVRSQRK